MRRDSLISRRFFFRNKQKQAPKNKLLTHLSHFQAAACTLHAKTEPEPHWTLHMRLIMRLHQLPGLPVAIRSHATQCLVLKCSLSWAASYVATDEHVVFWKGKLSQQPKLAWLNQWLNGITSGLSGKSWYDHAYGWAEVTWRAAKASQSCAHESRRVHGPRESWVYYTNYDCHMQTMYNVSQCRHMTRQITSAPCGLGLRHTCFTQHNAHMYKPTQNISLLLQMKRPLQRSKKMRWCRTGTLAD